MAKLDEPKIVTQKVSEPAAKPNKNTTSQAASQAGGENAKQAPKKSATSGSGSQPDFGAKFTWVFNNWRNIWDAFTLNIGTLVLAWLAPLLAFAAAFTFGGAGLVASYSVGGTALAATSIVLSVVLFAIAVVVAVLFAPALTIIQIESSKGNKIAFKEAWEKSLKFVGRYIFVYVVISLAVILPILASALLIAIFIGIILLPLAIVFAMLVSFFTMLVPYVLIEKDLSATQAINEGYTLAKQNWQWLAVVVLVMMLVGFATSLVGWIPVLGPLFSLAVSAASAFILAYIYVKQIAK